MPVFPIQKRLDAATEGLSDAELEHLARRLIRQGHGPLTHAVTEPVLVDLAGHRLPLNRGVWRLELYVFDDDDNYWVPSLAPGGYGTEPISDSDGTQAACHDAVMARQWSRYLIETAYDSRRYHHGAVWLDADDYPGGARFEAWRAAL